MAKTVVEKVDSPDLDVTIFKISGTLGFHENKVLTKFFNECSDRGIEKLVMDLSDLGSLGGGCAKIIREAAAAGLVRICISGASKTVQDFLENKGPTSILFAPDVQTAVSEIRAGASDSGTASRPGAAAAEEAPAAPPTATATKEAPAAPPTATATKEAPATPPTATATKEAPAAPPTAPAAEEPPATPPTAAATRDPATAAPSAAAVEDPEAPDPILIEVEDVLGGPEPEDEELGHQEPAEPSEPDPWAPVTPAQSPRADAVERPAPKNVGDTEYEKQIKMLKRNLVQYNWLFSLNEDFSRIEDKGKLLDAFLLTTIAQVGVEGAAFLEPCGEEFVAVCWKGFETADPGTLNIGRAEVDTGLWLKEPRILPLAKAPISVAARQRIEKWDLPYAAPFVIHDRFRAIVLLGSPIRQELDDDSWEFLSMMIKQVAIAYENSCRLEKESERTLGLVQSLISMVESNTLSRGTTELVMDLTYAVAEKMHYPDEHIRDLMYGTVLRDIGMINTSNLILRSPRELMQEEWEVIKQHPSEGAEMLEKMKFSEHTRDIVLCHHERYNGEGYPKGLAGAQIPLGARILSVVESYAAMIHDRPTRPALTQEEALNTLKENWGQRYDPEVVRIFIEIMEEEIRSGENPRYRGIDLIKN